jgi:NDP-sugar pyrophosphorylase family protein
LIPLANIPFTERTVHWLRGQGVDQVVMSLHYNAEQFMAYFRARDLGVRITFAVEEEPLGTGGAMKHCLPHLRSPRCFVLNGDIFSDLDLQTMLRAHEQARARITIAVNRVEDASRFGVIETDARHRILSFTEKPEHARDKDINTGLYIIERDVLAAFPDGAFSVEREIFPRLLADGAYLLGHPAQAYWTDLGTPEDYLRAHQDILARLVQVPMPAPEVLPGRWIGHDVQIAESAIIRPPVLLGDGTRIAAGATVGPAVVTGAGVTIARDALVENSVLWEGTRVLRDAHVDACILGRHARVSGHAHQRVCGDAERVIGP